MIRHSGEPHTHKPRNYEEDLLKRMFLTKIRERAINENTSNRRIFDEEIKKLVYSICNKCNNNFEFLIEHQN